MFKFLRCKIFLYLNFLSRDPDEMYGALEDEDEYIPHKDELYEDSSDDAYEGILSHYL